MPILRVVYQVQVETMLAAKGSCTLATFISLLPRVRSHVDLDVRFVAEGLVAQGAAVRSFARVDAHVALKVA